MVPWVINRTVGVAGGIPSNRTNVVDVTQSPYNADNTGATSAQTAIQNAINAATNSEVIYFPAGIYDITENNGISITKNNITLRGAGSNTMLVGSVTIGPGQNGNYGGTGFTGWSITSGAAAGSSTVSFSSLADVYGSTLGAGDSINITSYITSDTNGGGFQYIDAKGGEPGARAHADLNQMVIITNVVGNFVQFTPPLVWNFTNQTTAGPLNQVGVSSLRATHHVGLENFTLTTSNRALNMNPTFMCNLQLAYDCWVTNCNFIMAANYSLAINYAANCYIGHNNLRLSKSGGSNHAGLYLWEASGCLIEDNILADGLDPSIEWNYGVNGNAFFANFSTNTIHGVDFDMHNTHPVMNLWEENVCRDFELDGTFGSCSHETIFRNFLIATTPFKRWTTFINCVGNVMGNPSYPYIYSPSNADYSTYGVFEIGYPDEGDNHYSGVSGPIPWNYPGASILGFEGETINEAIFSITNTQVNTNVITGNFANLPSTLANNYALMAQDPVNTNTYYYIGIPSGPATSSNVTLTANTSVTNGWIVYVTYQGAWHWLQSSNVNTDIITGNAVCTNRSSYTPVWDANGVQSLTNSYLYAARPSWWGTNNWPAFGPDVSPNIGLIPAQERYLGVSSAR